MAEKRRVHLLPKSWTLPFTAAWRTFERTLNPAFSFLIKCENCGAVGHPDVTFVASKKNPKAVLGLECTKCLTTIKFEGTIDGDHREFPKRLKERALSVLQIDGKTAKDDRPGEGYLELMLGD